jgi:hypothetical protein
LEKLEEEQEDLLAQMMNGQAGLASPSDSSDDDSDEEGLNRFNVGGDKKYESEYEEDNEVVESSQTTPSPEQVPISDNTSPMIRKLEVPKIIKEDDYLKDISQLAKEQEDILA